MKKRTRSILQEINSIQPRRDKAQILESRGVNAISSIINLLEMIDANYDAETASDLTKRVMLSIKNRDNDRFMRGVKKVRKTK
jgi:predicted secreted Zn-dependent protease|tara:strand:+ start:183 stop:431 length:249 start_codon:yes stop_codon:yes gene_type:complete